MDFNMDDITSHLKDWAQKGMGVIGASGIPVVSDLANAASLVPPAPAPKPDPMAKPLAQEEYQSASYKPPFGNEAPTAPVVPPPAAPAPSVDDEEKSSNPKVASSHPGFNQDELEKYLMNEKGQLDKYGPEAMDKRIQNVHDQQNGIVSSIGRHMEGAADGIMQGVARAGNPGYQRAFDERQAANQTQADKEAGMLNEANAATMKAKEGLDKQSSANPLGASAAAALLPMLKQVYPGKTDAEYATMAHNPAVAEALLPEGVKLKEAESRLAQAKTDKAFQHQMALDNLNYRKDHDYMTREQKDTTTLTAGDTYKKAEGTLAKLNTALSLADAGFKDNATAKQALQTAMTFVATGGQRVNETEMKQFGGSHALMNRVNQWIKGIDAGTLTDRDYHDMKRVIQIYRDGAQQSMNDVIASRAKLRSVREGISEDQAGKELGANSPAPQTQITPDVQAYATKHGISPEQALQIKMQRTGGR